MEVSGQLHSLADLDPEKYTQETLGVGSGRISAPVWVPWERDFFFYCQRGMEPRLFGLSSLSTVTVSTELDKFHPVTGHEGP